MIEIRPSTEEDIVELYGEKPRKSLKSMSVYKDGELAALAGLIIDHTGCTAFCNIKDRESRNKITIWRHARKIIRILAESTKAPIYAGAEPGLVGAGGFLERLGFKMIGCEGDIDIYLLDKSTLNKV